MKKSLFCAVAVASCISSTAIAAKPTEQDAIAMVQRAAALMREKGKAEFIRSLGPEKTEFSHQDFFYIIVCDLKTGIVLADPYNSKLVGKDLTSLHDSEGHWYRRELMKIAAAQGKGWVSYEGINPITRQQELRKIYFERVDDVTIEAYMTVG